MLIIPIQNKPDWRRPPLMCFALILANLLMFVFYQGGDEARWQQAEEYYFGSDLPDLEEQVGRDDPIVRDIRETCLGGLEVVEKLALELLL